MSDYLAGLLARSFDVSSAPETVRPRLPSRFEANEPSRRHPTAETAAAWAEPPGLAAMADAGDRSMAGDEAFQPSARMADAAPPPRVPRAAGAEDSTGMDHGTSAPPPYPKETAIPSPAPGRPGTAPILREMAAPAEPPLRASPVTQVSAEAPVAPGIPLPPMEPPRRMAPLSLTPASAQFPPASTPVFPASAREPARSDETQPPPGPAAYLPEARYRQAEPARLDLSPTVIERLVVEKIIQPPGQTAPDYSTAATGFHPRPVAMPAMTSASARSGPASEVAPTIHVSIGRVEIRAAHPVAALPRPKPAGPAPMSLDDYLRRRNGGGR